MLKKIKKIKREILFKLLTKLILKHFREGIAPIYAKDAEGEEKYPFRVIAYRWTWRV